MGGEDDGFPEAVVLADDLPQQQAGLRIESRRRFVEEQHLGVVHHGARNREALHHAAGKRADHVGRAVGKFELFEQAVRVALAGLVVLAEVGAVEGEDLARGQGEIEIGSLRDDADQALGLYLLLPDVELSDEDASAGGLRARGQNADGGRFARAVGTEQAEDLAGADFERDAVQRDQFYLLLLWPLAHGGVREAGAPCSRWR